MRLFARLKYAAFLTVAIDIAVGIIGFIADIDVMKVISNPGIAISMFLIVLVFSQWIERILPFKNGELW